jgi:hypothetical protein
MERTTKDIIAIDIVRLRSKLRAAEMANERGDIDAALTKLSEVVGLTMSLVDLLKIEREG